jgi:hypothetical protein
MRSIGFIKLEVVIGGAFGGDVFNGGEGVGNGLFMGFDNAPVIPQQLHEGDGFWGTQAAGLSGAYWLWIGWVGIHGWFGFLDWLFWIGFLIG